MLSRLAPAVRSRPAAAALPVSRSLAALTTRLSSTRAPALADVPPDGAASFDAKQAQFRQQLREQAAKKREREESRSPNGGHVSASVPNEQSGSPSSSSSSVGKATGSLASNLTGEAKAREESQEGAKSEGKLSRLIYGTTEGRNLDRDMERSFSQVLARGKYVHSIVFHEVKPDKVDEYVKLVGEWYPKMASLPENKVHLVGSWRTEVGDCDTFVHIWEYQRYQGYHASLHNIQSHPGFPEFDSKLKKLIHSKRTSLMQEFSFWPTTPPRSLGGVFELRSYTLHPGNLLEWETHWRRGLKARREVMEGVGAWFVQIGDLNTVHHLWQFANLEERKRRREESWSVEGWGETVHKTVPLIQTMKSRILIPMKWSPVS
ncbi:Dimeric alpha-beta barrel [Lasiodiplodia theobromae]|uniref:Protein NipSnap-like protein 1 n=1 Tax=Lasiodiplodia theobromae TaxID=45133 RepID=A0A5N5DRK6_9PEZI|nr:Dimeric alpha-beta barrel [Lasiodiplodia theobromae]KAB2580397.1 Protein NipSnap-like protein 1 [Lasiodiplodia theobromae]KAF4540058.1 Dimeric alpha-beta barrel [Lasiodiplodia theobromae]KAF9632531.1 Dimeric alpha-beta barrel [Lasiodiplodia theobromae]